MSTYLRFVSLFWSLIRPLQSLASVVPFTLFRVYLGNSQPFVQLLKTANTRETYIQNSNPGDENLGPEAGEVIYPSTGSLIVLVRYVILDQLYRNPASDGCCTFEQISFNRVPGYILKHIGVSFIFPVFSRRKFFSIKCSAEFQNCLSFC